MATVSPQTSQLSSVLQTPADNKVDVNSVSPIKVSVDNQLKGSFSHSLLPSPIMQNLTMNQAKLLANNLLLASFYNQSILVFLQNQLTKTVVTITPELAQLFTGWMKHNKGSKKPLPEKLSSFLSKELNISATSLISRLHSIQLQGKLLELSFFNQDPIVELKLEQNAQQKGQDSLSQLLQMIIAIPFNDDSSVLIHEREQLNNTEQEPSISFDMTFYLEGLGTLTIKVCLEQFELNTLCLCDNNKLEQVVARHWPLLNQRLSKLGFNSSNRIEVAQTKASLPPSTNLINIQV